jgi:L-ascorbate metabolism protein UlaG (beta-lactamase superfamily)
VYGKVLSNKHNDQKKRRQLDRRRDIKMTVVVKWLGHASFQIKTKRKTIYIDPYEGEYDQKADLILVMHAHFDHCDALKINKAQS